MSGSKVWKKSIAWWPVLLLAACQSSTTSTTTTSTEPPATSSRSSTGSTSSTDTAEPTFQQQVEQVRNGLSDTIRLEQTPVSSEELASLLPLAQLRTLVLDRGVMQDADLKCLTGHPGLVHLRLRLSPLSDVGLQDLAAARLSELTILNLPQARPTAAGLRALGVLPKLRQLRIGGRQIDDVAIEELSRWPALESVHLIHPGITEAALETFAQMSALTSLYVDGAQVSDAAWERLQTLRPQLHLHLDQVHDDLP